LNPNGFFSGGLKLAGNEYSYVAIEADHSRQGSFTETVFGAMYAYKIGAYPDEPDYVLSIGTYMRWNDALIPVVKLDYHPFLFHSAMMQTFQN
jgi:hypothetical protein